MKDNYGRNIDYLRISITDRCNLRCGYCMPKGIQLAPMHDILTYEEIELICKAAVKAGITKFKITGGEPLVRLGCAGLIGKIRSIPGVSQVTLTTNGVLLGKYLDELELEKAADIIEQMDADDAVDVLEEVDEETREQLPCCSPFVTYPHFGCFFYFSPLCPVLLSDKVRYLLRRRYLLFVYGYFSVGMHSISMDMIAPFERLQNASHSILSSML